MKVKGEFHIGLRDVNNKAEISNSAILAYLENTAEMHSKIANNEINDEYTWMLLSWKVHFIDRPKFSDKIIIETWSWKIDRFYAYRDFRIYNRQGEVIAIASSKWIYIDCKKGKIIKVSKEIIDSYSLEDDNVFSIDEREFKKLREPAEYKSCVEFKITRNMIDTNNHLHNIYYLDIAKEALPEEVYQNEELKNFEITYKKEIKEGEVVKAFYAKENEKHIIVIKNFDETETHAIIEMS